MNVKSVLGCGRVLGICRAFGSYLREGFGLFSLLALLITWSANAQSTGPSTTVVAWGSPFTGGTEVPAGLNGVIGIASGPSISMGWRHDGTVVAWGDVPDSMRVPAGLSGVIGLAIGYGSIAAVKSDGTVVAWGFDSNLKNVPPGLTGVAAIATGLTHFLALKTDGTVVSWGFDSWANLPIPVTNATAIAAGPYFSIVLKSDGTIGAFGPGVPVMAGRPGFPPSQGVPSELGGGNVGAIAASGRHAVALRRDGTVVDWGYVTRPDLQGVGGHRVDFVSAPVGLYGVAAIAAGEDHTVALKRDGTVVIWGFVKLDRYEVSHMEGDDYHYGPAQLPDVDLKGVTAIAAGGAHSVALIMNPRKATGIAQVADGLVVHATVTDGGFGYTTSPPVSFTGGGGSGAKATVTVVGGIVVAIVITNPGHGYTSAPKVGFGPKIPLRLAIEISKMRVRLGGVLDRTYQLESSGDQKIWTAIGDPFIAQATDQFAEFDVAATTGRYFRIRPSIATAVVVWGSGPTQVPVDLRGVKAIATVGETAVALQADGKVVSWGANDPSLAVPAGLNSVTAIATGDAHIVALKSDGTVVTWGGGDQTAVPAGLGDVAGIAAGGAYTLAFKRDGSMVSWGRNGAEQPVPPNVGRLTAIAARGTGTVGVAFGGTVVGWGDNDVQREIPGGLTGVTALAAGVFHTVALKSDGTVVGWGSNDAGQISPPAGLNGVKAIAAGHFHTVALKIDGTVVAWGLNDRGQASGYSGAKAIAAGERYTLALVEPFNHVATATAQVFDGFVLGINLTDSGYGYDAPPAVVISGAGSGATAVATVANRVISRISILAPPGQGYIGAVQVSIQAPPPPPPPAVELPVDVFVEASQVRVRIAVDVGSKYRFSASSDLKAWTPIGEPAVAMADELVQEFPIDAARRYFRVSEVP